MLRGFFLYLDVPEDGRQVAGDVLVTLLEPVVLLHVMQVVPGKNQKNKIYFFDLSYTRFDVFNPCIIERDHSDSIDKNNQVAIDIPPDDDGSVHFLFDDDSGQNSAADGHVTGEGALLVDEVSLASLRLVNVKVNGTIL